MRADYSNQMPQFKSVSDELTRAGFVVNELPQVGAIEVLCPWPLSMEAARARRKPHLLIFKKSHGFYFKLNPAVWVKANPARVCFIYRVIDEVSAVRVLVDILNQARPVSEWPPDDDLLKDSRITPLSEVDYRQLEISTWRRVLSGYGWEVIDDSHHDPLWARFGATFNTNPHGYGKIPDPVPSCVWRVASFCKMTDAERRPLETDFTARVFRAFRALTPSGERINVLDWNHTCYFFDPHIDNPFPSTKNCAVPVLPDNDSYFFISNDFTFGTFGKCMYRMCKRPELIVFGDNLIDALFEDACSFFGKPIRDNRRL